MFNEGKEPNRIWSLACENTHNERAFPFDINAMSGRMIDQAEAFLVGLVNKLLDSPSSKQKLLDQFKIRWLGLG